MVLASLLLPSLALQAYAAQNVALSGSAVAPSQILDRRLMSFSIEFSFLTAFGGNRTAPNNLTRELMRRLEERTGLGPGIRPGGITMYANLNPIHYVVSSL